jgi:hypothetical protein
MHLSLVGDQIHLHCAGGSNWGTRVTFESTRRLATSITQILRRFFKEMGEPYSPLFLGMRAFPNSVNPGSGDAPKLEQPRGLLA